MVDENIFEIRLDKLKLYKKGLKKQYKNPQA